MTDIPMWSGEFWTTDEFGYLAVHVTDQRQHRPPEAGWTFVNSCICDTDDAEVFCYRRISSEPVNHYCTIGSMSDHQ